jgi:hypothetical protein
MAYLPYPKPAFFMQLPKMRLCQSRASRDLAAGMALQYYQDIPISLALYGHQHHQH